MSDKKSDLEKNYEYAWQKYSQGDLTKIFELADRYKNFISICKTERECIAEFIKLARKQGYSDINDIINDGKTLKAGDKVYANNRGKSLALYVIGKEPFEKGLKILGAHVDSPRMDLKQNPLYEDTDLAMLETHYYGGIKKYQWVTIPLAIHGVIVKKDGEIINVIIGEDESDPVFGVSDLLIHLSQDQLKKSLATGITGEDLNILVGSIPSSDKDIKTKVKYNILKILNEKYNISEEDFVSAELEVVPAGKARDYGFDKSMIMGYGQDDRICAYTSFEAMMDINETDKTCVTILADKEEIGSVGATGMHSKFFENATAEVVQCAGDYNDIKLKRALANSKMLSSDVSAAFDPNYPSVMEKKNTAYLGKGVVFNKYTGARGKSGCNDARAEYLAEIRAMMDKHNVSWQTSELGKVDQGGGGTIAYILAQYGMDVIDSGVALLNMHAPWEISSKVDIYETQNAYRAFLIEA
ncbi:putative M18 family aminopeptidase 1 [Clostridium pasteurianum DSM 525 = ATCC 6013]|uniref:M18 family aminopeptidase n=1 Tax=Clostridium pasteurianum DSM 525 = ATCC 6013 TaxID=1262449 RepID=A0A0H3J426_CLOPA|nr:aminopeptidase [Clostridium pasteurianum]AJA48686.1 putative M18 family aminopeptidase 1 [Clostridium pasteurianum DSM 525 = ATCC 6013]AJA52674.1 putative M18 family aminopeptidase 1 [Clostridium pasteurianum DSM 525 = ATCC 6013]AOZ75912.1 aminopeptidase [Clostridium pasteurianum DSM 525 = ATCC 6013]AOZ79708.1 aminopeptidase [Clostridium pasteurianum]ELP59985.1 aminopeptidase 1 [Clostridium pasteurianum DSM 525 = ATCC 6013]